LDFDERLLALQVRGCLYLDGLWQSENYFKDVEAILREDLRMVPPADASSQRVAEAIRTSNAVAVHVRWFEAPGSKAPSNLPADYYHRAVALIESKFASPSFFLFSDDPDAAREKLALPKDRTSFVDHKRGDNDTYTDLWLMTQCRHFIIANSTFGWWGAWLGGGERKVVLAPDLQTSGKGAWGFKGLIPSGWVRV
jgi:hypothetical protein